MKHKPAPKKDIKLPISIHIVEEIKIRPFLWLKTDDLYLNNSARDQAFDEILTSLRASFSAELLSFVGVDSRRGVYIHWRSLRDTFSKKMIVINGQSGIGPDKVRRAMAWPLLQPMMFLSKCNSYREDVQGESKFWSYLRVHLR